MPAIGASTTGVSTRNDPSVNEAGTTVMGPLSSERAPGPKSAVAGGAQARRSEPTAQQPTRRSANQRVMPSRLTRSWTIVSRSRMVTALSSRVSKSTVTQNGVPISSWRR